LKRYLFMAGRGSAGYPPPSGLLSTNRGGG
jgi:hypothetical protein